MSPPLVLIRNVLLSSCLASMLLLVFRNYETEYVPVAALLHNDTTPSPSPSPPLLPPPRALQKAPQMLKPKLSPKKIPNLLRAALIPLPPHKLRTPNLPVLGLQRSPRVLRKRRLKVLKVRNCPTSWEDICLHAFQNARKHRLSAAGHPWFSLVLARGLSGESTSNSSNIAALAKWLSVLKHRWLFDVVLSFEVESEDVRKLLFENDIKGLVKITNSSGMSPQGEKHHAVSLTGMPLVFVSSLNTPPLPNATFAQIFSSIEAQLTHPIHVSFMPQNESSSDIECPDYLQTGWSHLPALFSRSWYMAQIVRGSCQSKRSAEIMGLVYPPTKLLADSFTLETERYLDAARLFPERLLKQCRVSNLLDVPKRVVRPSKQILDTDIACNSSSVVFRSTTDIRGGLNNQREHIVNAILFSLLWGTDLEEPPAIPQSYAGMTKWHMMADDYHSGMVKGRNYGIWALWDKDHFYDTVHGYGLCVRRPDFGMGVAANVSNVTNFMSTEREDLKIRLRTDSLKRLRGMSVGEVMEAYPSDIDDSPDTKLIELDKTRMLSLCTVVYSRRLEVCQEFGEDGCNMAMAALRPNWLIRRRVNEVVKLLPKPKYWVSIHLRRWQCSITEDQVAVFRQAVLAAAPDATHVYLASDINMDDPVLADLNSTFILIHKSQAHPEESGWPFEVRAAVDWEVSRTASHHIAVNSDSSFSGFLNAYRTRSNLSSTHMISNPSAGEHLITRMSIELFLRVEGKYATVPVEMEGKGTAKELRATAARVCEVEEGMFEMLYDGIVLRDMNMKMQDYCFSDGCEVVLIVDKAAQARKKIQAMGKTADFQGLELFLNGFEVDSDDEIDSVDFDEEIEAIEKGLLLFLTVEPDILKLSDADGNTMLHNCTFASTAVTALLVKYGADINARNSMGITPLVGIAAYPMMVKKTEYLISVGADVSTCDNNGSTPLHTVTCIEVAMVLVTEGADVNAADVHGDTPLHHQYPFTDVYNYLVEQGADQSAKNKEVTLQVKFPSRTIAVDAMASESIRDVKAAAAAASKLATEQLMLTFDGVELDDEARVDAYPFEDQSEVTVEMGRKPRAEMQLKELNWSHGDLAVMATEIKQALTIRFGGGQRDPASLDCKYMEILKLLCDADAIRSMEGVQKAFCKAVEFGLIGCAEFLLKSDLGTLQWTIAERVSTTTSDDDHKHMPLGQAVNKGHPEIAKMLIELGANMSYKDPMWGYPLHDAVDKGLHDVVQIMLQKNADITVRNRIGLSPLFVAVSKGYTAIVRLFLYHVDNPDFLNCYGDSLLHSATTHTRVEIVQVLLDLKADVNLWDSNRDSALCLAVRLNHPAIVQLLLSHGADPNIKDSRGLRPLRLAVREGYKEISDMLRGHGAEEE